MFTKMKTSLFETTNTVVKSNGSFVDSGLKMSSQTLSGNGALKYSTTGDDFVNQFGKLGQYKSPRSFEEISKDMSLLYSQDKNNAVKFLFYLRIITRQVSLFNGEKTVTTQRGAGLKHESIMRMLWLFSKDEKVFWDNIVLFLTIGSWKDLFEMMRYDLQYHGWDGKILNWDKLFDIIQLGLTNENFSDLIKKYLPHIKAKSKCKTVETQSNTLIGKFLSNKLFGQNKYKEYRQLKTSGNAHQWQQLISQKDLDNIDFNKIHGRALSLLISGKFIQNNSLVEKYEAWIDSQPIAKFTGYPHELFTKKSLTSLREFQLKTINKQFKSLVETAKNGAKGDTSMIVVRDTSGSMGSPATGTTSSCGDVAKALALFFSEMLPSGHFSNSWIEFNSSAKLHNWKGIEPVDKWMNDKSNYIGSTNFQSVIDLFINIKKTGVSEGEFPTGIICISDSEFNPSMLGKTNVETALTKLRSAGFSDEFVSKFKIVLWNLQSNYYGSNTGSKFETHGNVGNVYYFSGFDGSVIVFLTGLEVNENKPEPKNAKELFEAAMDQEVINLITI
jgi:hypothetical protein